METVNRLLEITDGKQGTRLVRLHAHAAVKIVAKRTDDFPLRRIGILRFVDQNMVDLPVEFETHPIGHLATLEQGRCSPDHVVKIDCADGVFGVAILRSKFLADVKRAREPVGILGARDFTQKLVSPLKHLERLRRVGVGNGGRALRTHHWLSLRA